VRDQLDEIEPLRRVAAREHTERRAHGGERREELLALRRRELSRIEVRRGAGAAVRAHQIAGLRGLPDGNQRVVIEVERRATTSEQIGGALGHCRPRLQLACPART
jgi:hypothetical protein